MQTMSETPFMNPGPARAEVDAMAGAAVLEFGTAWCGHCRAAEPAIQEAFAGRDGISLLRIEDGSGRKLGRSFGVKLWPTLIFLNDGQEVARLVRPTEAAPIARALAGLEAAR